MKYQLENYFVEVVTGKRKGMGPSILKGILSLISIPFRMAVGVRNWAFDRGLMRRYCPPVPVVISIGNIVLGGTGKTPVTLLLAGEFYNDFLIGILSRGYRSLAEKLAVPVILCKGEGPQQTALFCGDEPFLLAENLPKAYVIVGRNRHKASDMAAKAGVQLILLDDGMQHRHLARDLEVVVMDMYDPYGQGHYFPRGLLREGVSSLRRAHLIILNHVTSKEEFIKMKEDLSQYTQAIVVGTKMQVTEIKSLKDNKLLNLKGKKVGLFCGIAHPEYFRRTVEDLGGEIVDDIIAPDHQKFEAAELLAFAEGCKEKGAELLICTEKDKVKIDTELKLPLPIAWIKMRLNIVEGQDEWNTLMNKIRSQLQTSK